MRARLFAVLPIAAALALVTTSASDAGFRRLRSHYAPGEVITAYSHYGNGTVSSVVRPGRHGWQVRLPRGTWVSCRRSCEETLRVQTIDVFGSGDYALSNGGYGTLARECGIFGCLHWEWRY
jgi:hypothetical protein